MHQLRGVVDRTVLVYAIAGIVIGMSIATAVPPEPIALPAIGTVPGVAAGGIGLALGIGIYRWVPRWIGASGCGCGSDCECA